MNGSKINETINYIEETWNNLVHEVPLNYSFLDERIGGQYQSEKKFSNLFLVFSVLSIIIACLGLFGLATYATEQRTKEIGIRKVMGASSSGIVLLLSKDFLKLILFAGIISIPAAYFLMNKWLQSFAFHTEIKSYTILITLIIVLSIAQLTISYKTLRAANANPVKSLKYE